MKLDKRTKFGKFCKVWFNRYTRAAFVAGIIAGALVGFSLVYAQNTSPKPLGTMIKPEVAQATTDKYKERGYAYCSDPIICIRDVGEELGVPNQDIITMIKIARAESNFKPNAKNPNSTATGIFQIIIGTWDGNRCEGERWDFVDNIKCAYKLYKTRGFQPWNASRSKWSQE